MALGPGDRVRLVHGPLAGVEGRIEKPSRLLLGRGWVVAIDSDAPRWAAIRRTRVLPWALAPLDDAPPPHRATADRRRLSIFGLAMVGLCLPVVALMWTVSTVLGLICLLAWVVALGAAMSALNHAGR